MMYDCAGLVAFIIFLRRDAVKLLTLMNDVE